MLRRRQAARTAKNRIFVPRWRFLMMNNFEDELDKIRVQLYEETKDLDKASLVKIVNSNAKKIADEFGIKIMNLPALKLPREPASGFLGIL
jgi:hypothetical protein